MALAVVQTTSLASTGATNASSKAVTFSATSAGNLAVVAFFWTGGISARTLSTLQDNNGTAWSSAVADLNSASGNTAAVIYYLANAPSLTSVTLTLSGVAAIGGVGYEISGAASSSPLDQTGAAISTNSAASVTAAGATSLANEIVIAILGGYQSTGVPTFSGGTAGFTITSGGISSNSATRSTIAVGQEILSSTATPTFAGNLATSTNTTNVLATFKQATGGGVVVPVEPSTSMARVVLNAAAWCKRESGLVAPSRGFAVV